MELNLMNYICYKLSERVKHEMSIVIEQDEEKC